MKKKSNLSLSSKANAAFNQAAKKVIQRAKETSTPVVIWENGTVKEIPAHLLKTKYASLERKLTNP
jgi:hypothetical protein